MNLRTIQKYLGFAGVEESEYEIGGLVVGKLCVVENATGDWEVIDFRHGRPQLLQAFPTDDLACYYLFGVLAEEHIAAGKLVPA